MMESISQVYFPTFSRVFRWANSRTTKNSPPFLVRKVIKQKNITLFYADLYGSTKMSKSELVDLTAKLNELAVGNRPVFTSSEETLEFGVRGSYEWQSDVMRFDRRVIEFSFGKPVEIAAHETRHRMVLLQLAFPFQEFDTFSEYVSPFQVEAYRCRVRNLYPRWRWEAELDAFVIGHVAHKMYEAGHSLEEIAQLVKTSAHHIPYFDGIDHMLLRFSPPPVNPMGDLVTSSDKGQKEYLKRPFGVKQYLLGFLAMRIRSTFLQNVSFLINKLKQFLWSEKYWQRRLGLQ